MRLARIFLPVCLIGGVVLTGGALAFGLFCVPPERLQGDTVRIIFLHVPAAWLGMAGWSGIAAGSFSQIVWRHPLAPALFGLVGTVNLPIIHYSVIWWNSQHQPPSITLGKSAIAPIFLYPLLAATLGFTLIFAACVLARMRAILADRQADARLRRMALGEEAL